MATLCDSIAGYMARVDRKSEEFGRNIYTAFSIEPTISPTSRRCNLESLINLNGRPARLETDFRMQAPCAIHRREEKSGQQIFTDSRR